MTQKRRRKWTPAQKLRIVIETLQSDRKLAEICRREGVSPDIEVGHHGDNVCCLTFMEGLSPRGVTQATLSPSTYR